MVTTKEQERSSRAALEPLQVTIREAATLLRYNERTVRRLFARDELHATTSAGR